MATDTPKTNEEQGSSPKPSTPPGIEVNRPVREILGELFVHIKEWFIDFINLEEGLDREGTILSIRNSKRMRGANAWLLIASIIVASIGLDLNSDAVIIGGMLISPLMAPILGIGLSVGTNDKDGLFISLRHFGIAMLIALVTSTLYFMITPLGSLTPAIEARTAPTFLDCLVAIFGGLAGIVSTTRKDKGAAIPGVAIATALMPPLCVTGYGIATGNGWVAINSFYLFFLNSFFIALTTLLMVRFLKFPFKTFINPTEARRTTWITIIFSILIVLPSARILFKLWQDNQYKIRSEQFIKTEFGKKNQTKVIDYAINKTDTTRELVLELLGRRIPEDSIPSLRHKMERYGIEDMALTLIQASDLPLERLNRLQLELSSIGQMADNLKEVKKAASEQEMQMRRLMNTIDSLKADTITFSQITREAKVLFPNLTELGFARSVQTDFQQIKRRVPTVLVSWDNRITAYARRQEQEKLRQFLQIRAHLDTVQVLNY